MHVYIMYYYYSSYYQLIILAHWRIILAYYIGSWFKINTYACVHPSYSVLICNILVDIGTVGMLRTFPDEPNEFSFPSKHYHIFLLCRPCMCVEKWYGNLKVIHCCISQFEG